MTATIWSSSVDRSAVSRVDAQGSGCPGNWLQTIRLGLVMWEETQETRQSLASAMMCEDYIMLFVHCGASRRHAKVNDGFPARGQPSHIDQEISGTIKY